MTTIEAIVVFLIVFIFAALKIRNEKLSIKKYVSLIFLPPVLVSIYIGNVYNHLLNSTFMLSVTFYGLIFMSPALMFYTVHTLSLEKKFSPSKWKLFIWAGLLGGLSALPYLLVAPIEFIAVPIVTGSLAMMIVYYASNKKKKP